MWFIVSSEPMGVIEQSDTQAASLERPTLGWVERQVAEIAADPVLRYYGIALAAVNVLTFVHWRFQLDLGAVISDEALAICWPLWESCHAARLLPSSGVEAVLWAYAVLSTAVAACFVSAKRVRWGYWGLLLVTVIRLLIVAQDFRLRANQHYMATWVALAFLFFPAKRLLIRHLIVSLYVWAGVLKLDREWLTGEALYNRHKLWVPAPLIPASCVYVVVLETILVFGLYARRAWLFWLTLGQFALFHLVSWPIVGFYYPLLMFCLLSIFVLDRALGPRAAADRLFPRRHRLAAAGLLGTFALCQLVPYTFPGDTAITGEGRLFALHMFDAKVVCEATATFHLRDASVREVRIPELGLVQRIKCDPVVFLALANSQCRDRVDDPRVVDFDLRVRSRRTSDPEFRPVIDVKNFCASGLTYDLWRPNDWILK